MLKLLGMILILAASSLLGLSKSRVYGQYAAFLQELLFGLEVLETEVQYRQSSLGEGFIRTGLALSGKDAGRLFDRAAEYLACHREALPQEGLLEGVAAVADRIPAGQPLKAHLEGFALTLGKGDLKAQQQVFALLRVQIGQCLEGALKRQEKEEKLWRYLGVCSGIVFVILLV
ncbi:MAG: stage III sporulation protein AB [Peptococcaceae bacterium]|nr:stage III sporulation protein AB [Peptococcaceae bacterium]